MTRPRTLPEPLRSRHGRHRSPDREPVPAVPGPPRSGALQIRAVACTGLERLVGGAGSELPCAQLLLIHGDFLLRSIDPIQHGAYRTPANPAQSPALRNLRSTRVAGPAGSGLGCRCCVGLFRGKRCPSVRQESPASANACAASCFSRFMQAAQQHIGSGRGISMNGHDGVAAGDELEGTRLVEPMTGKVQTIEIVAGRAQAFEEIELMFLARDQPCDLGRAPFDASTVRCENGDPGSLTSRDAHLVIDAFYIVLRKIAVAAKVIGAKLFQISGTQGADSADRPVPSMADSRACAEPARLRSGAFLARRPAQALFLRPCSRVTRSASPRLKPNCCASLTGSAPRRAESIARSKDCTVPRSST